MRGIWDFYDIWEHESYDIYDDLIGKIEFFPIFSTWSGTVSDHLRSSRTFTTNVNII